MNTSVSVNWRRWFVGIMITVMLTLAAGGMVFDIVAVTSSGDGTGDRIGVNWNSSPNSSSGSSSGTGSSSDTSSTTGGTGNG